MFTGVYHVHLSQRVSAFINGPMGKNFLTQQLFLLIDTKNLCHNYTRYIVTMKMSFSML